MGIAFQMVDDIRDVVGHSELLGKPTGMDLRDGNPALPIILALNESQPAVCEAFERSRPTDNQITIALDAIKAGSAIQQAKSLSKSYAEEALKSVKKLDRKSTRLNSSHRCISYAVFCLKKKKK